MDSKSYYDPKKHHRRSIRLPEYDYLSAGYYFIILCTQEHHCLFGSIHNDMMALNSTGCVIAEYWRWLAANHSYVELDEYVIMPNHLHGIIIINDKGEFNTPIPTSLTQNNESACRGGSRTALPKKPKSLGRLIAAFKTVSTKHINQRNDTPGTLLWQRNYYEHIVRSESELRRIQKYIRENPIRWDYDHNNLSNFLTTSPDLRAVLEPPLQSDAYIYEEDRESWMV